MNLRVWLALLVAVIAGLLIARCNGGVDARVDAWMECIECTDHELDSVVVLGGRAVTRLGDYALNGPPTSRIAHLKEVEDSAFARLRHWDAARLPHGGPAIRSFGDLYVAHYQRIYRLRSVIALSRIGTTAAHNRIDRALLAAPAADTARLRVARDSAH